MERKKIEAFPGRRRRVFHAVLRLLSGLGRNFAAFPMAAISAVRSFLLGAAPVFIVDIEEGKATVRSGKVNPRFLKSCEEIAAGCGLHRGEIRGVRQGRGIGLSLDFSRSVPESSHQQFRNAWRLEA